MTYVVDCLFEEVRTIVLDRMTMMGLNQPAPARSRRKKVAENTPVDSLLKEVHQAICNYCNIDTCPEDLKYVWANMTIDYWRYILATNAQNTPSEGGAGQVEIDSGKVRITSLKEGDTTVQVTAASKLSSSEAVAAAGHDMSGVLDKFVLNYQDQLNRFRKVVW